MTVTSGKVVHGTRLECSERKILRTSYEREKKQEDSVLLKGSDKGDKVGGKCGEINAYKILYGRPEGKIKLLGKA
jgi:hypothetical protein